MTVLKHPLLLMEATYSLSRYFLMFVKISLKSTLSKALSAVEANSKHNLNRGALVMCKAELSLSA